MDQHTNNLGGDFTNATNPRSPASPNAAQAPLYSAEGNGQTVAYSNNGQPLNSVANTALATPPQPPYTQPLRREFANTVDDKTTILQTSENDKLTEKLAIINAKIIVENTHNDPRLQSQQLSVLRKEYLLKRYGKKAESDEQET